MAEAEKTAVTHVITKDGGTVRSPSIFIWIPKTGGTALWHSLPMEKMKRPEDIDPAKLSGLVTFGHMDLKLLSREGKLPPGYVDKARKFAVVRDPYDRAISLYCRKHGPGQTLADFLAMVERERPAPGLYNDQGLSLCSLQAAWLMPGTRLLRFEGVSRSLPMLTAWLGIPLINQWGNPNPSKRAGVEYTQESWRMVEAIYGYDFKRLGYAIRPMPVGGTPDW